MFAYLFNKKPKKGTPIRKSSFDANEPFSDKLPSSLEKPPSYELNESSSASSVQNITPRSSSESKPSILRISSAKPFSPPKQTVKIPMGKQRWTRKILQKVGFAKKTGNRVEKAPLSPKFESAQKVVSELYKDGPIQRKLNILKRVCSSAGQCLVFGNESEVIRDLFNNFIDFQYALPTIKRIGEPSANGFVHQLDYVRDDYRCSAVLKSSNLPEKFGNEMAVPDNLYYEYYVGTQFLNPITHIMPCFVETYGIYLSKSNAKQQSMQKATSIDEIKRTIQYIPDKEMTMGISCGNASRLSILIQHIHDPLTMYSYVKKFGILKSFWTVDVIQLMYQVYAPLSLLGKTFTHYDLHTGNVLLYNLKEDECMEMVYHYKGQETRFYTQYIAKIIDYGRAFCEKTPAFYKQLCKTLRCNTIYELRKKKSCGTTAGYSQFHNISNTSQDLRLAFLLKSMKSDYIRNMDKKYGKHFPEDVDKIEREDLDATLPTEPSVFDKIVYDSVYSTREMPSKHSEVIYNIFDMETHLREYIQTHPVFQRPENDELCREEAKQKEWQERRTKIMEEKDKAKTVEKRNEWNAKLKEVDAELDKCKIENNYQLCKGKKFLGSLHIYLDTMEPMRFM